jgi:hypothetical protein
MELHMDYSYLFNKYAGRVVDPDNKQDPLIKEITQVGTDNGLDVHFVRTGPDWGGAAVMPRDNEVRISLAKGADRQWHILEL